MSQVQTGLQGADKGPNEIEQNGWLAQELTKAARVKLPQLALTSQWIPRGLLRAVRSVPPSTSSNNNRQHGRDGMSVLGRHV
jgi:hypothetical protein